ncbi:Mediator of U snRNA nuclear export PHAX [Plasmopara halstedii]|uniref:Phosphorylated adapter RNA export protein n=1 Tax=Plasmopara halstedii TaxID=4781 RepID=A0A0P1ASD6_PLAHL|nr:Mediator of U snRNA nuclear export PHAX [Plasmopara halstedii]CEG44778.1 Mediator of U snRNA nuclear export PHAX [Plasmopara halstedii]|eukprot:XP_024581147.1 Mediator of U snRNA nuclear export PHAX [Plasmopara halstedii]
MDASPHSTEQINATTPALSDQFKHNVQYLTRKNGNSFSTSHDNKPKRRRKNYKQPLTKDMPQVLSEVLKEPKLALLHRVVKYVGPNMSWKLLRETLRLEREGGQIVNAVASGKPALFCVRDEVSHEYKPRRRTSGGVFFTLLKEKVPREVYRTIYEVEDKKKKCAKKRARDRQRQRMDHTLAKLGFDDLTLAPKSENGAFTTVMEVEEDEVAVEEGEVAVEDGESSEEQMVIS